MSELILTLIAWLSAHSPYVLPATPPAVITVSHADLCKLAGLRSGCPYGGLFHPGYGAIYVREDFPPTNRVHLSVVLHELVHWGQWLTGTGRPLDCQQRIAWEREAQSLQAEWLYGYPVSVTGSWVTPPIPNQPGVLGPTHTQWRVRLPTLEECEAELRGVSAQKR